MSFFERVRDAAAGTPRIAASAVQTGRTSGPTSASGRRLIEGLALLGAF
jgi:hypothetical protein